MSAGAIRAGRAFVELVLKDNIASGLRKAQQRMMAFAATVRSAGTIMMGAGAAIAAPLAAATRTFLTTGDHLAKMRDRTGISVEKLSELGHAAEQSGVSVDTMGRGLNKMSRFVDAAFSGSQAAIDTLDELGISMEQLQKMAPEERFLALGDAISKIEDADLRKANFMQIFGGGAGASIAQMFTQGAAGARMLMEEARALGLVLSTEDAEAAVSLGDKLANLWSQVKMGSVIVGASLAPALDKAVTFIGRLATATLKWVSDNRALVVQIGTVAAVLIGGGAALLTLAGGLSIAGIAFGALATLASAAGTILSGVLAVVGAILSPVGLVATAVIGAAGAFLYFSGTGQAALEGVMGYFSRLSGVVTETMGGVYNAIMAGDLDSAWKIVCKAIEGEWLRLKIAFTEIWNGIAVSVTNIADSIWTSLRRGIENTINFIAKAMLHAVNLIQRAAVKIGIDLGVGDIEGQIAALNTSSEAWKARLSRESKARQSERENESGAEINQMRKELRALEDERRSLLNRVAEQAETAKQSSTEMQEKLPTTNEIAAMTPSNRSGTAGTFSAAAAARMGFMAPPIERLTREVGKGNRILEDIRDAVEDDDGESFG